MAQPLPEDLKFGNTIAFCGEHHDFLRRIAFGTRKPIGNDLYNIIEPMWHIHLEQAKSS
jgi:hypothetical protein